MEEFAISKAIAAPITFKQPFLHFAYPTFFDSDVYSGIDKYWPKEFLFRHFKTETGFDLNGKKTNLNQNRCSFADLHKSLNRLERESSEFWSFFFNDYIRQRIDGDSVLTSPIQNRLQKESGPLKVNIFGSLVEDLEGSAQGIHIDPTNIISTLVAYVPYEGQSSNLGTHIYSILKDQRNFETYKSFELDLRRTYVSNSGAKSLIKIFGQIPYFQNHAVLIPFSPFALHSVSNPTKIKRRSVLIRAAIHNETMLNIFGHSFEDLMRLANVDERYARAIFDSMSKTENPTPSINSEIEVSYHF